VGIDSTNVDNMLRVIVPGVAVVMGIRDVGPEEIVASEAT
jgi:hypothetical protein